MRWTLAGLLVVAGTLHCKNEPPPAATPTTAAPPPAPALAPTGGTTPETPTDLKDPQNVEVTPSGLKSRVLKPGNGGAHPTAQSRVTVHYSGWLEDGTLFDSSVKRGTPATFPLGGVIKGWTEGVQLMTVGEKRRFWIPYDLAYGERGRPPKIPEKATLVFDVELLAIGQ